MVKNPLQSTLDAIDEINAQDPNIELHNGQSHPKELLYSMRMTETLISFTRPSELLQIAARGQHIKRWAIPRKEYPEGRKGYLKWRTQLKIMHGQIVGDIMLDHGYAKEDIEYVKDLLMKKDLKKDPDTQILEDVICLVFLKYHIDEFTESKEEDLLTGIIQKTWSKMSEKGHQAALKIPFSPNTGALIKKALKL